ncbi:hypothetical protein LPJ72_004694 [Coemansia sp. Benny D160-2]|nr:hypothetical protein LPJ72_004694 [Coemansia sp. Benny D160-2]
MLLEPLDNPGSLGELRTQMCERLDEQWLMLQQLTQCMHETTRQLATLTAMVGCGRTRNEQQQQQTRTVGRPLRFNPQSADDAASSAASVSGSAPASASSEATIALRAPLYIKERPPPRPKRRTAPLSIHKMMTTRVAASSVAALPVAIPQPQPQPHSHSHSHSLPTASPLQPVSPKLHSLPAPRKKDPAKSVLELARMFEHSHIANTAVTTVGAIVP